MEDNMNKDVEKYLTELKQKLEIAVNQNNNRQAELYRAKIKTANKVIHLYESIYSGKNFKMEFGDYKW
jgi:hypothetical protein